jgi:rare lipoprotein A
VSGFATFYHDSLHGDLMANGEPYDMWDPTTAASNLYPLGTRLKVTRVVTGQSIVVRVTDRGAFEPPLLVDLSYAAFVSLADPDDGRIRVIVEPID